MHRRKNIKIKINAKRILILKKHILQHENRSERRATKLAKMAMNFNKFQKYWLFINIESTH